jgi:hypothetical protein
MNKKLIIISVVVSLALGVGVLAWRVNQSDSPPTPTPQSDQGPVPENPKDSPSKTNPDGTPVGGTGEPLPGADEAPPGAPTPVKSGENVGVTLSRATVGESVLTVAGYAETTKDGTCTLTLTKTGQKTLTYTNPTELEVSTVSCNPFRVPLNDFPSKGNWKAVITFEGSGLRGTSNEWIVAL